MAQLSGSGHSTCDTIGQTYDLLNLWKLQMSGFVMKRSQRNKSGAGHSVVICNLDCLQEASYMLCLLLHAIHGRVFHGVCPNCDCSHCSRALSVCTMPAC